MSKLKITENNGQIIVEPIVGSNLEEILPEVIEIAKNYNKEIKLLFNTCELYVRPHHTVKELFNAYLKFCNIHKIRVITDFNNEIWRKIKIFGVTSVRGNYNLEAIYEGYIAKDDEDRVYKNNWYSVLEDSISPYGQWWCKEELKNKSGEALYWDVIWAWGFYNMREEIAKKFSDIFNYCKEHNQLYYKDQKCLFCLVDKIKKKQNEKIERSKIKEE